MVAVEKSSQLLLIWILISTVYWSDEFLKLFAKWAIHAIPSRTALSLDHAHSCTSIHYILRFALFFVHNCKYREHLEKKIWKILGNPIELPHYGFQKKMSQLSYLNLIAFFWPWHIYESFAKCLTKARIVWFWLYKDKSLKSRKVDVVWGLSRMVGW